MSQYNCIWHCLTICSVSRATTHLEQQKLFHIEKGEKRISSMVTSPLLDLKCGSLPSSPQDFMVSSGLVSSRIGLVLPASWSTTPCLQLYNALGFRMGLWMPSVGLWPCLGFRPEGGRCSPLRS